MKRMLRAGLAIRSCIFATVGRDAKQEARNASREELQVRRGRIEKDAIGNRAQTVARYPRPSNRCFGANETLFDRKPDEIGVRRKI
jgi:hypothetical protein